MNKKNDQGSKSTVRSRRVKDESKFAQFVEELSWLLSTYQNLDFRSLPSYISILDRRVTSDVSMISGYISENPNIHFLVGVLPYILDDTSIFSTNEEIASFAGEVLRLRVPRWQKKSKYEIIGHVVCNVYKLNDSELTMLVTALTKIVSGDEAAKRIVKEKSRRESNWNEIIRRLSQQSS